MSEYANYDDYNDPEEENEYEAIYGGSKKMTAGKIFKKTFFWALRIVAVFVFGILFWRIASSGDTKLAKEFLWNDKAISAYTENAEDFSAYFYKRYDNLTEDGKFSAGNVYFVPSLQQFQITVRYNDSTLKKLAKEYDLESIPDGEVFVFTLSDNLGNRYTEYEYAVDEKNIYNYRRVVFDGIDMNAVKTFEEDGQPVEKKFEELYINIYYADDVVYSEPYGKITIYDTKHYHEPIDLSEYPIKNNAPSESLKKGIAYIVKEDPEQTDNIE